MYARRVTVDLGGESPGDPPVRVGVEADTIHFHAHALRVGSGMHEVVVPWTRLERLEAVDPWPGLRIRWREAEFPGDAYFTADGDARQFEARVEQLVDYAAEQLGARASRVIADGWLARADVQWEVVAHFPRDPEPGQAGVYRTAAPTRPHEPILARRAAPSPYEALLVWLASTPEEPLHEHVREVLVTDAYLYARRRNGAVARLPIWALYTRLGSRDSVYVFGRRVRVILPERDAPCPVVAHLDRVLLERGCE